MVVTVNKISSRGFSEVAREFQNPDCCCYRSTLLRHLVTKWQCSNCVVHGLCGSCSSTDLFLDCVWLVNLLGKLHSSVACNALGWPDKSNVQSAIPCLPMAMRSSDFLLNSTCYVQPHGLVICTSFWVHQKGQSLSICINYRWSQVHMECTMIKCILVLWWLWQKLLAAEAMDM